MNKKRAVEICWRCREYGGFFYCALDPLWLTAKEYCDVDPPVGCPFVLEQLMVLEGEQRKWHSRD